VSWIKPASNGSPITGYTITTTPGGFTKTVDADTTSTTIDGLTNGTDYTFTVTATNAIGTSAASVPSAKATPTAPATRPDAPTGVTATAANASAVVSWTKPASNGSPITGYVITTAPGGFTKTVDADTTSTTISGLTNGTDYTFTVTATNNVGTSAASVPSAKATPTAPATPVPPTVAPPVIAPPAPTAPTPGVVARVPLKPAKPVVKAYKGYIKVTWKAPRDNGARITKYYVKASNGTTRIVSGTARTLKFKIKKGKKVSFKIRAANKIGIGGYSPSSKTVKAK
jgi:hypothetical protein